MKKFSFSGVDEHLEEILARDPALAKAYAEEFAKLPLSTQLGIMRRRRWLSQKTLARKLRVKQPHVSRMESRGHDPRLSSLEGQTRALHCRLMIVPEELLGQVAALVARGAPSSDPRGCGRPGKLG